MIKNKLHFKRISAKNFKSIGNSPIEFHFDNDKTLITSDENGAGKSTLLVWALFYVLFDKPFSKKSKKNGLINDINDKSMVVEVDFISNNREYRVIRGKKPNIFNINVMKDGEYQPINDKPLQDDLIDIIGFDENIFQFVVVLGKDRYTPFFEMTPPERREVNEKFIDTSVFTLMSKENKNDTKTLKLEISNLENNKKPSTGNQIQSLNDSIKALESLNSDKVGYIKKSLNDAENQLQVNLELKNDKESKKIEILNKIDSLKLELAQFKSIIDNDSLQIDLEISTANKTSFDKINLIKIELDKTKKAITKCHTLNSEIQSNIIGYTHKKNTLQAEIDHFNDMDICSSCSQEVTNNTKERIRTDNTTKIDSIDVNMDELNKKSVIIKEKIQKLESHKESLFTKQYDLKSENDSIIAELQSKKNDLSEQYKYHSNHNDIKQLEISINHIDESIDKINIDIENINKNKSNLNQELESLKKVELIDEHKKQLKNLIKEYKDIEMLLDSHHETLNIYDMTNNILADDGFKSVIFKKYLPFFNKNVNNILESMGLFLNFTMNENYSIELNNPSFKNRGLYDLSDGQKCRINLAILMTWREIAKNRSSVDTNLLILDEVLEALSSNGVGDFMDMTENLLTGSNTYVITQRGNEFEDHFNHRVNFKLVDEFTDMEVIK